MIKTTPINSVRVLKVGVTLHFHFSDSIVYKGECWCIRGRNYEYGQPVETANEFLQNVTRGCLNRWTELKENFSDHFTLYSTRSSYVTNILEEGVSRDDVCKLTGHSYEVMTRHYDRMRMRNRIPEVTKRMYGKRDKNPYGARKLL